GVLVVDDTAPPRDILVEMLPNWGMRPTALATGEEALDAIGWATAAGDPYGLLLVDAIMPGLDGFALAERLRDGPAKILMLTPAWRATSADRCRAARIQPTTLTATTQSELLVMLFAALSASPPRLPPHPPPAPAQ